MKPVRYAILNPSGNLTALVTAWGGREDEEEITRRLMRESEQVAYLERPLGPGAVARIRLMGGEFCGNAAMAAAGWAARDRIRPGEEITVPIEVSGAEGTVFCRIRGTAEGFEGTVEFDASKPDGTMRKLIDVTKLHSLGWTHKVEIEDGVKKLFDWYKSSLL